eukprot:COSAG02_NODE_167_length_31944_cov_19.552237_14_plen_57_part_00
MASVGLLFLFNTASILITRECLRGVPLQEGALTASYTSDATDDAVQANVVAAGYGR